MISNFILICFFNIKKLISVTDCSKIVDVDTNLNQIILKKPDSGEVPKSFTFDHVYGDTST